jgi:hypothetical protein
MHLFQNRLELCGEGCLDLLVEVLGCACNMVGEMRSSPFRSILEGREFG